MLHDGFRRRGAVAGAVRRRDEIVDPSCGTAPALRGVSSARLDSERVLQLERGAEARDVGFIVEQEQIAVCRNEIASPSSSNSGSDRNAMRMFSSSANCVRMPPADLLVDPEASASRSSSTTSCTPSRRR